MKRLLITALAAGALAGGVAGVAIPKDTRPQPEPLRFAPERPPAQYMRPLGVRRATVRIALRRRDPAGGPDWALRTFVAEFRGEHLCAQLGRVAHGRFGWVDGTNTFRPVGPRFDGAPLSCGFEGPDSGPPPRLEMNTLIAGIERPDARLTRTVIWGYGGPATTRVDLRAGRQTSQPRLSGGGGFIEFRAPTIGRRDVRATFHLRGREPKALFGNAYERSAIRSNALGVRARRNAPAIDARAPDPNGGLPYGIGVFRSSRGLCITSQGRVVGERLGPVDYTLGTFETGALPGQFCSRPGAGPTRRRPVNASFGLGSVGSTLAPGADPATGRLARRTLPGITSVSGTAHPDVESITIATPRDVRTLTPSPRARAFIAVYDGEFPTGAIIITAHFKDGTSRVADRFELGGI